MKNLYTLTLLLILPLQSFSQSLTQTIDQQINAARVGQAGQVMVLSGYGNGELRQGLNRLETYMGDSSVQVRARTTPEARQTASMQASSHQYPAPSQRSPMYPPQTIAPPKCWST